MKHLLAALIVALALYAPPPLRPAGAHAQPGPGAQIPPASDEALTAAQRERLSELIRVRQGLPEGFVLGGLQVRTLNPGTSADGVVLRDDGQQLWLDTNPCETRRQRKQVKIFNSPYTKSWDGEKNCRVGDAYANTKVTQR